MPAIGLARRLPIERAHVIAIATVLLAVAILGSIAAFAFELSTRVADLAELENRLDTLMQRPLPAPAVQATADDGGDIRLIAAPAEGAAVSILQNSLSDAAAQAGFSVDRLSSEPASGEDDHQIVVRAEGSGSIEALQTFLFNAETGFPYFFIDTLEIEASTDAASDVLGIVATVRANWKAPQP